MTCLRPPHSQVSEPDSPALRAAQNPSWNPKSAPATGPAPNVVGASDRNRSHDDPGGKCEETNGTDAHTRPAREQDSVPAPGSQRTGMSTSDTAPQAPEAGAASSALGADGPKRQALQRAVWTQDGWAWTDDTAQNTMCVRLCFRALARFLRKSCFPGALTALLLGDRRPQPCLRAAVSHRRQL